MTIDIIGRLGPGNLLGEMSLLGKGFTTAAVVADTDTIIAEISLEFTRQLFNSEVMLELK
jgi:CRP-like cAMP-binding protein